MRKLAPTLMLVMTGVLAWLSGLQAGALPRIDLAQAGPCLIDSQALTIDGGLETVFYFPSVDGCGGGLAAPYPGVVFAHGFSMFGLYDGAAENADNGQHLASWGYVVAVPRLPDDAQARTASVQRALAYLETQTRTVGSLLYHKIDVGRLATTGHSLGRRS